jgi:hypothetical protein
MRRMTSVATAAMIGGAALLHAAPPVAAAPPDVLEFPVTFREYCPGSAEPVINELVIRRSVKTLPDGRVHYFLNVSGTVTSVETRNVVRAHGVRRFTDDEANHVTRFAGVQVRFSAGGAGVLHLNAGRAAGPLSQPMNEWTDFDGRWDGIGVGLPASVCEVLVGS